MAKPIYAGLISQRGKTLYQKILPKIQDILPQALRADEELRRTFLRWLLLGLLLRLLFMPFSLHTDFLSEHVRVEQIAFKGNLFAGGSQYLAHYLDALFLRTFAPLLPDHAQILALPGEGGTAATVEYPFLLDFLKSPYAYRTIFLLKLPYLLFDLASGLILLHFFTDLRKGLRAFKFWMVNPVMIYAVFIYGRYETYALFFILLSLFYLKRRRKMASALCLGLAIPSRAYALMYLPLYLLFLDSSWKVRARSALLALLPTGAYSLLLYIFNISPPFYKYVPTRNVAAALVHGGFAGLILEPTTGAPEIHLLVLAYILLFLWAISKKRYGEFSYLFSLLAIQLFLFFSFSFFSTHWFAWTGPFLALIAGERREYLPLLAVQIVGWFFYSAFFSDWSVFTLFLFAPLHPQYFVGFPNATDWVNQTPFLRNLIWPLLLNHPDFLLSVSRTFLAGASLWLIYLLGRGEIRPGEMNHRARLSQNEDQLAGER